MNDLKTQMETGVILGDCCEVMPRIAAGTVDLIVTDPPYLVDYRSDDGRAISGDRDGSWLEPAFKEMYRLLKEDAFCISFYGWNRVDEFMAAWQTAGFRPVGHIVFVKDYPSNRAVVNYKHEMAYVLQKGNPEPNERMDDVQPWGEYTGNVLHPTQKPVEAITHLIKAFSKPGDVVLDPFCGSGTTLMAARDLGRSYLGIEMAEQYAGSARERLQHGTTEEIRRDDFPQPRRIERNFTERDFRPGWSAPRRRPWLPYEEWRRQQGYRRHWRE